MKFLLRLIVNAVAIYAAVALLNGQGLAMDGGSWVSFFWLAVIFSAVNTFIKPLVTALGCPLVILTMGLGTLLINTLMFFLTAEIAKVFHIDFQVTSFWGAFLGAIIISIVSMVLNTLLHDQK